MSAKRALVVDDSKSARLAMKSMLKKHNIKVDFAESGEEALHFLEHSSTDVIFMDHTMPGMDGLEAVSAIKSNPSTATIPVMMYTTKEGDVYVSQARALGALAVLPKEVQPGVLFEMLLKLGLVEERREEPDPAPFAQVLPEEEDEIQTEAEAKAELAFEQEAFGASIKALVTRTLEDQHLRLRTDILTGNRDFARRVSKEILDQQHAANQLTDALIESDAASSQAQYSFSRIQVLVGVGLILLLLCSAIWLALTLKSETRQTQNELLQLSGLVKNTNSSLQDYNLSNLTDEIILAVQKQQSINKQPNLIKSLEWALNENNHYPYQELAFNQNRLLLVQNLLIQLASLNFNGSVQMEAHVGEFCLIRGNSEEYQLAPNNLALSDCHFIGHPKDQSIFTSEHQSVEFVNFLDASPVLNQGDIRLSTIARNRINSTRRYSFPADATDAGEWNRIAALNNRIVYTLIPDA